MKFVKLTLVSCAMVGLFTACCWATVDKDEMVPKNAASAKDVVNKLQKDGATNIRSVEFDDNQWNVKTQHGQKETEYKVHPKSGTVTSKHEESEYETAPPRNVLGIIEVINTVERRGLKGIREVEYDDSLWKVEVVQDGKVTKLCLDPIAGDIIWQDTQPVKTSDDDSDDSSTKSKYRKIRDAIKDRFTKDKSDQGQSTKTKSGQSNTYRNGQKQDTGSTSKPWQNKSQYQDNNSSNKSGSSTSGWQNY